MHWSDGLKFWELPLRGVARTRCIKGGVFLPLRGAARARQNHALEKADSLGAPAARGCQKQGYEGCVSA